jgi:hypothetical protein
MELVVRAFFVFYSNYILRYNYYTYFFLALPRTSDGDSTLPEDDDQPVKKKKTNSEKQRELNRMQRHNESLKAKRELTNVFSEKIDALISFCFFVREFIFHVLRLIPH